MADDAIAVVPLRPIAVVVRQQQVALVAVSPGGQGPPGRNGVNGAEISPDPDNQLDNRDNGLYVPPATWQTSDW